MFSWLKIAETVTEASLYHVRSSSFMQEMNSSDTSIRSGAPIEANIVAYEKIQDILEAQYMYIWGTFHNEKFVGVSDSFDHAAYHPTQEFGSLPFLISSSRAEDGN